MEQVIQGPTGELVHQMQLVVIMDKDEKSLAYTLIASDLEGEPFAKVRGEFEKMLKSFSA
jgi:hypothetical protein